MEACIRGLHSSIFPIELQVPFLMLYVRCIFNGNAALLQKLDTNLNCNFLVLIIRDVLDMYIECEKVIFNNQN